MTKIVVSYNVILSKKLQFMNEWYSEQVKVKMKHEPKL